MLVTMSQKELNRIPVLQQVCDKLLTQSQSAAAKLLNISVRQLQRVLARYLSYGAAGIASRKRGMPANNRAPDDLKLQVLALLREKYSDFGPTLATEKLSERHQIMGRSSNHRLPESLKLRVLSLLHDRYSDFGPTLAAEKLCNRRFASCLKR